MSFSLSFNKAILVVIFIADKIRQGQYEFLSSRMISEILNIPKPTLVPILHHLSAHGIVETKEGKHGGIRLLKDPAKVTVWDILEAVEKGKPVFNPSFDIRATGKRPDQAQRSLLRLFSEAESAVQDKLRGKTVAQILEDMER